jgi:hypothetical protein
MRLVLISDAKGVPVGYDLTGPKTGQERERALELAAAHAGSTLFADKGFWGKEYRDCMELIDIQLITPERHRSGPRPAGEVAKARIRLVIESVSPISSAKCAWNSISPRHSPGSCSASLNDSSPSHSACTSTSKPAAHHAPSPPTTADKPTSSL